MIGKERQDRAEDAGGGEFAPARDRLVLFGDPGSFISTILVDAALSAAEGRPDLEVVAVCDAGRRRLPARWRRNLRQLAGAAIKRVFDPPHAGPLHRAMLTDLAGVARRRRVPVVVPPSRDVNDPGFLAWLRRDARPTAALSLAGVQVFSGALLACFEVSVNYHNAALPRHRGLRATRWSIYAGDRDSGYTFHRMVLDVDAGPILLHGSVPIDPDASPVAVELRKTRAAADRMPELLQAIRRRLPGTPQQGSGSSHGMAAIRRLMAPAEPATLTAAEIERRIRAFDMAVLTVSDRPYRVTRVVRRTAAPRGGLHFITADGVEMAATRIMHVPLPVYRAVPWLGRVEIGV